jgi:hypothetical protein
MRALYRALVPEGVRAQVRPLVYARDSIFRAALWRAAGGRVHTGPFRGLRLAPRPYLPHLLGTYELELHPTLEALCTRKWTRLVNVGGGNGFYVAGLGLRLKDADLVVFELDPDARTVVRATLERNGLAGRARVLGAAEPGGLQAACTGEGSLLVVMDVEGAEVELTDPTLVPALRRATILVETHEFLRPGCRERIELRFTASHRVSAIETRPRTVGDFPPALAPLVRRLAPERCGEAVQEWRPAAQTWLLLEPKGARDAGGERRRSP